VIRASGKELIIEPETSLEELAEFCESIVEARQATPWWVGDIMTQAPVVFGEDTSGATEKLEECYTLGSLNTYASTARRFPPGARKYNLPWSYYRAVAAMDNAEEFLEMAEREGWQLKELKEAIGAKEQSKKQVRGKVREKSNAAQVFIVECENPEDYKDVSERLDDHRSVTMVLEE